MTEKRGWDKLLDDPFFQHIKTNSTPEDIERLLGIIGQDIYSNIESFSIEDPTLNIPGDSTHRETIGAQAERAKKQLQKFKENPEETKLSSSGDSEWLYRFLSEKEFQSYVFRLFSFLSERARGSLRDSRDIPSYMDRAKAAVRDNVEELEDEVERAEAARESAEKAQKATEKIQKAVEKAQTAAEEAKNTAESIIPNMLTTLGVFIAIVIAVIGCYLSVLLSHYTKNAETLDMTMILLMGHILMNIIFLLLYLISKMSVHSLACHCLVGDQMDCLKCDPALRKRCRLRHKLWLRYPYVVAMNGVFVAAYCILGLWYLIDRYFGMFIDQLLKDNMQYAVIVVGGIAGVVVAAGVFVFLFLLRSPQLKVESARKKEQKTENTHKSIRGVSNKLKEQENRITLLEQNLKEEKSQVASLEKELKILSQQLEEYMRERNHIPVQ